MAKPRQPYLSIIRNAFKKEKNHPDLTAFITLQEPLPAGVYEFGLFEGITEKGNKKYSGMIKSKVEIKKPVQHFQERDNDIPF